MEPTIETNKPVVNSPAPASSVNTPSRPASTAPSRATAPTAKPPTAEAMAVKFDSADADDLDIPGYTPEDASTGKTVETAKPTPAKETPLPVESARQVGTQVEPSVKPADKIVETPAKVNPLLGEPVKPSDKTRDYTGFSPEEVTQLKQMSNTAFDFSAKIIKENKELAKLKDSTYLQSPEAYRLDPAYTKAAEDVDYLRAEAQIWKNQLVNIKTGKEWSPLLGWDKSGKPVFDTKRAPGEMDEEDVRSRMQQCEGSAQQMAGQLQQMQQSYANRVATDNSAIDEVQKSKFSWVADPALAEKTVTIPNLGERSIKQITNDFKELLPAYHRGSKLAELGANMFAALQVYASEIRNLQAQLQITETKRADALRAEPTSSDKPANAGGGVAKSKFGGPASFDLGGLPD